MTGEEVSMPSERKVRPGDILLRSWYLYRDNFLLFILIAVIGQALYTVRGALSATGVQGLWAVGVGLVPAAIVIRFWAGAALIVAASSRHNAQEVSLKGCFAKVEGRYLTYVMATVLYSLASVTGLLLLIVPGLYVGTILCLAAYVAVLEDRKLAGSFRRSRQLVAGSFWRVLLIMLFLGVLGAAGGFAAYGLSRVHHIIPIVWLAAYEVLLWPFSTAVHAVLYRRLAEKEEPSRPSAEAAEKEKTGCLLALLCAIGLMLAIVALLFYWRTLLGDILH